MTRHIAFRMLMRINSGSIVRKIVRNTRCKILEILEINVANKVVSRPNCVIRSCYAKLGLVLTIVNPYSDYRSLLPLCYIRVYVCDRHVRSTRKKIIFFSTTSIIKLLLLLQRNISVCFLNWYLDIRFDFRLIQSFSNKNYRWVNKFFFWI